MYRPPPKLNILHVEAVEDIGIGQSVSLFSQSEDMESSSAPTRTSKMSSGLISAFSPELRLNAQQRCDEEVEELVFM